MMNQAKIGEVICDEMITAASRDHNLLAVTSDSRGSASLTPFAKERPKQLIEMGIAEQNAVTVAAGLAHSGKRPFVFSPAAFLTMRSIEQVKVDVAYSNSNVKLIGISGGNSYSVLGATHHSLQDLAITRAIPDLEVYMPADQAQTRGLMQYLVQSDRPAYVRIGKRALPNIYDNEKRAFSRPGQANILFDHGHDVALVAMGETLSIAVDTAKMLNQQGIHAKVVDLVSLKPLDHRLLSRVATQVDLIVTIEEHSIYGGIGSAVAESLASHQHAPIQIVGFPDELVIAGTQDEVFAYYGMDAQSLTRRISDWMK
ncbi:transketolase family protein [Sporolactobacillus sp. KGMB 08714]|uniref:transketolase family protein n=1 Tax=unclassified Sporolactobacillus TaxID=2628533 RepID=UPI003FA79C8D